MTRCRPLPSPRKASAIYKNDGRGIAPGASTQSAQECAQALVMWSSPSNGGPTWRILNFLQKGCEVNVTPFGYDPQCFLATTRRSNHHHTKRRIRSIAPGVRDTPGEGDACAGCGVECFVPVCYACRAFQNKKMLIFILMKPRASAPSSSAVVSERLAAVRCGF